MKSFNDWNPDKSGNTDVTTKLQNAVDWCISNDKTLYIPPGTYKVNDKILAEAFPGVDCGGHDGNGSINIFGDAYDKPVIKLADNASGFDNSNPDNAKPVIEVNQQKHDREACLFWCTIRNLDFDLGSGNQGAAAIDFGSAQDCSLSNIKVFASGSFAAGFIGVPGRNASAFNLEVNGGKYGLYLPGGVGLNLVGITCKNQSQAGIYIGAWRGSTIVGLEINGCPGPAIELNGYNDPQAGNLVLTDAKIEISNSSNYAFQITDKAIVLRNVYVNGTNNIVQGNTTNWTVTGSDWTKINTYSYTPSSIGGMDAYNIIDNDKRNGDEIKDFSTGNPSSPADLVIKNLPEEIYGFNHPDAVNVEDYGAVKNDGNDDLDAFQQAVDNHSVVYVPAGKWHFNGTLLLKDNTAIVGDPGKRSDLVPINSPSSRSWLISTENKTGYAAIQDMAFDVPNQDYFGAIHWQISSGFILNVRNYLGPGHNERNKHNYEFTGNAGGKAYGISEHNNIFKGATPDPNFRKVYIQGTSNPLTFYGLNLERGGDERNIIQYPFCEAVNASNLRFYGTKPENWGVVYKFSNCNNITVTGLMNTSRDCHDATVVLDNGTDNVEICITQMLDNNNAKEAFDDQLGDKAKYNEFIGLYRVGDFNLEPFNSNSTYVIVDAGNDTTITLPVNSVTLKGSAQGNITSFQWSLVSGHDTPTLNGAKTNTLNVSGMTAGSYSFKLEATDDQGNTGSDMINVTVNPELTKIHRTTNEIIIDGEKDAFYPDENILISKNIEGTFTHTASFSMLWNSDSLYCFVSINDSIKRNDSDNTWNDDALELYLDADNSKGTNYDGLNDFQYIFGYNTGIIETGGKSLDDKTGIRFAQHDFTNGYNFEISIPWNTLNVMPQVDDYIGLDVHVLDDDTGDERDAVLSWNDEQDIAWENPSVFGTVQLSGQLTKIQDTKLCNFKIYPNPVVHELHVKGTYKIQNIKIYRVNGTMIYNKDDLLKKSIRIDASHWQNGFYLIRIKDIKSRVAFAKFAK
jgi:hypothetical protein